MEESDKKKSNLRPNDPYRNMRTAEDDTRPEFLDLDEKAKKGLKDAKQNATKAALTALETMVGGVPPEATLSGNGGESEVGKFAEMTKGLYSKTNGGGGKGAKKKSEAKKLVPIFIFIILLMAVPTMLLSSNIPLFLIGHIDFNLMDSLGFTSTGAILEKQGSFVVQEALQKGKVPDAFANDLASHGIEVGQISSTGDFVRTNVYLADLSSPEDQVASIGDAQRNGSSGELAVRFKDKIISASNFVAAIESDPEMYGEYSDTLNIETKFFYSDQVNDVYKDLGASRNSFGDWQRTGDKKADQESFDELLTQALDGDSDMFVNGYKKKEKSDDSEEEDGAEEDDNEVEAKSGVDTEFADGNIGAPIMSLAAKKKTNGSSTGSKETDSTDKQGNNVDNYTLLEGYKFLTFYGPSAEENGGNAGLNADESINNNMLADGQAAHDTRDGGALNIGDVVYIETTADSNAEGSYANGKYYLIADEGGETHGGDGWDIDIFANETESRLREVPYGEFGSPKVYKVASGVSWDEYLEKYHDATGGSVQVGTPSGCSNGGVVEGEEGFTVNVKCDANTVVRQVGEHTTGAQATEKAAQLLNVAISATEPYKAVKVFSTIEEVLQRARINGDGPIDEMMKTLDQEAETTYMDTSTGEEVTVKRSILADHNFSSAISRGNYDRKEAQNFQRDRFLYATGVANDEVIHNTTLATNGQKKSNAVLEIKKGDSADTNTLSKFANSLSIAVSQKSSELFRGIVGANRGISGGSSLLNTINSRVVGGMPSDAATIAEYHREADKVLARRAEAERATKSPFDITSRNTFLGSIVHNMASLMIANRKPFSDNFSVPSVLGTVADFTSESANSILGAVMADGPRNSFAELIGNNCFTVNSIVSLEGDLYCTEHNTISTKYMDYTKEQYDGELDEKDKEMFALLAMARKTTAGVKDGEVCEVYKDKFDDGFSGAVNRLLDLLSKMVGLYNSCSNVGDEIALQSGYTLSGKNDNLGKVELLASYARYDITSSIINGTRSEMATIINDYYDKHPLDNSPEGWLARVSGLTKDEARVAINYSNYLTMIANYNPTTRYAFGGSIIEKPFKLEFIDDSRVDDSVYLAWFGRVEFFDIRNRSFVV